jgi:hypothetical protein
MMAAALTGAYAEGIPNFEVMTLAVFAAGVLLGARDGMLVGALTMLTYSLLNPYGPVHPLVTAAQIAGEVVPGAAGGFAARLGLPEQPAARRAVFLGVIGAGVTVWFDLVTNLATGLVFGQMRLVLIGGIPLSVWHIGTNLALFALLGTPLVGVFAHYRARLSSLR